MPKTENFQWYVERVHGGEFHGHSLTATLASGQSQFQTYAIVNSIVFGKMLVLDGDTQSAALDEYIYHEALVHPACATGTPQRALVLGGGEGATVRELLRVPSMKTVTMVDIDAVVVEACRAYMPEWAAGALEDARTELVIGDAKAYIESTNERFDIIIGDLTEPLEDSPSYPLHTIAMYKTIRGRLNPGGYFALQTSMAGPHNLALHARMTATLRAVFANVSPYATYVPGFDTVWGFALCGERVDTGSDAAALRADKHAAACGGLRFYDAESHRAMFNLPRYLRDSYRSAVPLT